MNSRGRWFVVGAILVLALLAGFHASSGPESVENERNVTVSTCEALPDYDFERMVSRVERIKGKQLNRNLSLCVEQTAGGIDTTPSEARFAHVEQPGLSFFELDATASSQQRSSLGYTTFSPSGGPIEIFLANETVVENVSWISYEGLVAHELSHAIDDSHLRFDSNRSGEETDVSRTTDWLLANRAVSEGSATYVAELYVQKHEGEQTVSKLGEETHHWKHQILVSVYSEGYHYSKNADITSSNEHRVNSTAKILHPEHSKDPSTFPTRPNLSINSLEHRRTDRIGELFLRETFVSKGVPAERAAAAADGWANDRMDYYRANDSTVVTWRVAWQNADEMVEFVETYGAIYDYERVDALGSVDCREPGRYLAASEETTTIVLCGDR